MKKVILIDGNNLLFRSYYATAYSGNMMTNSKGFSTNALFGFTNMINKILKEEKPEYILVALDKGKTFRHESYDGYKDGRLETPSELKEQIEYSKKLLDGMGIAYLEAPNYEADDIIGTFAKMADDDSNYDATIISSDKDLLQLISKAVDVKLLKTKDYIRMNHDVFVNTYGIEPIKIIDLKGLQGDPSDNIPGVKGVGEKTALKLLIEYGSLENVYASIDKISGKLKEKLVNDRDNAFMSKSLATICKEVPVGITFKDIKYEGINNDELIKIYEELEFYSFLKRMNKKEVPESSFDIKIVKSLSHLNITSDCSAYLEILGSNYHKAKVLGMGIYDGKKGYYIPLSLLKSNPSFLTSNIKYTYDLKKLRTSLLWNDINTSGIEFDLMLAGYLLNYSVKDDIAYLANMLGYDIPFYESVYGKKDKYNEVDEKDVAELCIKKAKFIYEIREDFIDKLKREEQYKLFKDIELPLSVALSDMEYTGVSIDKKVLVDMGEEIKIKMELISKEIFNHAGIEFNIMSPKQLGEILFDKLSLPYPKRNKTKYSTSRDILMKLKDIHPIILKVLEYRMYAKLHSNYIEGLLNLVYEDDKIHTIYNQTLTKTGRLSATEPNIQNMPVREEYGRLIRKAFIPSKGNIMMTGDYSQIELRILAHISGAKNLIKAFKDDLDIHTQTAAKIFDVKEQQVTKKMRFQAKAVNFGIIYGISSFGLSEDLNIDMGSAKVFIDKYFEAYPGIKKFMQEIIKSAYDKGYVTTIMNRKRVIDELKNKNYMIKQQGERMALNTPIQGSSADIIKKAMIEIYEEFNKQGLKSKMLIQVHDELVFDIVNGEKAKIETIVKNIMENTYKLDVPMKVDIDFGNNWYEAK